MDLIKKVNWTALFQLALLAGSAYLATNPKLAWLIPVIQGAGAITPAPKIGDS